MTPHYCHDGMCGAEDCARCHPELAASDLLFCPDCDGVGRIPERRDDVYCDPEHECLFCQGTGRVTP